MRLDESVTDKKSINKYNTLEERFREIHGDKYDYSKVVYKGTNTKITIICLNTNKVFEQLPSNHVRGQGCPCCKGERITKSNSSYTSEFIVKANSIHNNIYNYDKFNYVNNRTKSIITCPIHGDFSQTPNSHLNSNGCPICGTHKTISYTKYNSIDFVNKSNNIHNFKYSYIKTKYIRTKDKVIITCPIHGDFSQRANDHIMGCGCPVCATESRKLNLRKKYFDKPTILYYIKISKKDFPDVWKIGITTKFKYNKDKSYNILDKNSRFIYEIRKDYKIEVLKLEYFETGKDAWYKEQLLHDKYKEFRYLDYYCDEYLHKGGGDTELFIKDCYSI